MAASKAQRARVAERRTKAIKLRIGGMDWQDIADQLGYASRGAACTDVSRALEQYRVQEEAAVETLRHQEGMRLDRLMASVWPKALGGDIRAVDSAVKIIDRRAKLFGLDVKITDMQDPAAALSMIGNIMSAIDTAAAQGKGGDGGDND